MWSTRVEFTQKKSFILPHSDTRTTSLIREAIERQGNGASVDLILSDLQADSINPSVCDVASWAQSVPLGTSTQTGRVNGSRIGDSGMLNRTA